MINTIGRRTAVYSMNGIKSRFSGFSGSTRCISSHNKSNKDNRKNDDIYDGPMQPGKLSIFELGLKYGAGTLMTPLALVGLGFQRVPANNARVLTRFGKYQETLSEGLHYRLVPGLARYTTFMGKRTYKLDPSKIPDADGKPVVVSAVVDYCIEDAAKFEINVDGKFEFIFNQAEKAVKNIVRNYPYESDDGEGLKTSDRKIRSEMIHNLQSMLCGTGVRIHDVALVDVNYAPEVAKSMLAKQEAMAQLEAKEYMVKGAFEITKETIEKFGDTLDHDQRGKMATNVLTVLVSGEGVQPVIAL